MSAITPNRVAAVATWAAGLGAFGYGILGTFPHSWQPTALIVSGLLTKASVAVKFMGGSQNIDTLQAQQAMQAAEHATYPPAPAVAVDTPEPAADVSPGEVWNATAPFVDYAPAYAGAPDPEVTA